MEVDHLVQSTTECECGDTNRQFINKPHRTQNKILNPIINRNTQPYHQPGLPLLPHLGQVGPPALPLEVAQPSDCSM